MKNVLPVTIVLLALFALWYAAAALMNASLQEDAFANAGRTDYTTGELVPPRWKWSGRSCRRRTRSPPNSKDW